MIFPDLQAFGCKKDSGRRVPARKRMIKKIQRCLPPLCHDLSMSRTSIGSMLGSCGSSKDDADEPGVPDVNPQLDWNFTYETSQTDDGVVIKWKAEEKTKSISEKVDTEKFFFFEKFGGFE